MKQNIAKLTQTFTQDEWQTGKHINQNKEKTKSDDIYLGTDTYILLLGKH